MYTFQKKKIETLLVVPVWGSVLCSRIVTSSWPLRSSSTSLITKTCLPSVFLFLTKENPANHEDVNCSQRRLMITGEYFYSFRGTGNESCKQPPPTTTYLLLAAWESISCFAVGKSDSLFFQNLSTHTNSKLRKKNDIFKVTWHSVRNSTSRS